MTLDKFDWIVGSAIVFAVAGVAGANWIGGEDWAWLGLVGGAILGGYLEYLKT